MPTKNESTATPANDIQIISSRLAAQRVERHSISNTVTIDGVTYQFEEREFHPGFSMVLPSSFEELAPEFARVKYPYEDRPETILSNEDTSVNFTFDCLTVAPDALESRLTNYKNMMKKLHPSYTFFSENIYNLETDLMVACYDYQGSAIDTDIYYLTFFTDLPSGELFGCFSCPVKSQSQWAPLVREMIQTIKTLPQETEGAEENA